VIDPPRRGARDVVPLLARMDAATIAYVSCDPVTFARDAAKLCDEGYRLESVTPYDMFPHTHHVEVLGWFRREPT
jgi:23S rRNA (uracil1939-C5)-methyltransferase